MQEPPDNTEDWEAYESQYATQENKKELLDIMFDCVTDTWTNRSREATRALKLLLEKGYEHLDIEDASQLFVVYEVAPSFDSFCESLADDGPDPDIGRDDE